MDELSCPRCRMTKYRNPSLKLMINACGHALCEACVDLIFTRESGLCPECGRTLKKNGFRTQLFEDTRVDKEVDIRKWIMRIYNKRESDFKTLREYNDYLEEVEDIIWSLESGRNEKMTREKIAQYKIENEALIRKNHVRLHLERSHFKEQMAKEAEEHQKHIQLLNRLDRENEVIRQREQEELLNDLTNNTAITSSEVLARRKKMKANEEASRLQLDGKLQLKDFCSSQAIDYVTSQLSETTESPFVYEPLKSEIGGPNVPSISEFYELGYLRHVRDATNRDLGGGYSSVISCDRALNDAFGGLFLSPSSTASNIS